MGFFMRPVPSGVTKPTLESGLTLVTANGDIDFDIVNNDVSNPAAVDLAFTTPAIQAAAFDQGTAQSPSYVLEAGTTRTISLLRDYGAEDYGDGDVTESVNALLPDGTFASQTLTVEPYIEVTGANSFGTFNGSSDYLSTPYNAAYGFEIGDAFSVAMWINIAAGAAAKSIIGTCNYGAAPTSVGWVLDTSMGGGSRDNTGIMWFFSGASDYSGIRTTGLLQTGGWVHYAFIYDGSWVANGFTSMKQYVNGALDAHQDDLTYGTFSGNITNTNPLFLGGVSGRVMPAGSLDDVGVWSRELTSVEVASIYTNKTRCHKVQRSDLVCYYDFDYVSGSLTGGIKDRTPNDFKMWFPGFEYGQFGTEWMETPYNAIYDFAKDEAFTVSLWVLGNDASDWANIAISHRLPASWVGAIEIGGYVDGADNVLEFVIRDSNAQMMTVQTSALDADRWYHIVGVKAAANALASLTIYVDGVDDTQVGRGTASTFTGTITTPSPLAIGAYTGGYGAYEWEGQIHDVGIWNIALDATAITALAVPDTRVNTVQSTNLVGGWTFPIRSKGTGLTPEVDISGNGLDMMVES